MRLAADNSLPDMSTHSDFWMMKFGSGDATR